MSLCGPEIHEWSISLRIASTCSFRMKKLSSVTTVPAGNTSPGIATLRTFKSSPWPCRTLGDTRYPGRKWGVRFVPLFRGDLTPDLEPVVTVRFEELFDLLFRVVFMFPQLPYPPFARQRTDVVVTFAANLSVETHAQVRHPAKLGLGVTRPWKHGDVMILFVAILTALPREVLTGEGHEANPLPLCISLIPWSQNTTLLSTLRHHEPSERRYCPTAGVNLTI